MLQLREDFDDAGAVLQRLGQRSMQNCLCDKHEDDDHEALTQSWLRPFQGSGRRRRGSHLHSVLLHPEDATIIGGEGNTLKRLLHHRVILRKNQSPESSREDTIKPLVSKRIREK
jgi:hypothetical protein